MKNMKKITVLFIALVLMIGLSACGRSTVSWQEQYDLGVRYLTEGNYSEAIVAFNTAIEIDPKRAEAYIGLADVYVAQGDIEKARQVLEDALAVVDDPDMIRSRLDELEESAAQAVTAGATAEPASGTTAQATQESMPGTTSAANEDSARIVDISKVKATATDIHADSVFNSGGYGSLAINSEWNDEEDGAPAQLALLNSDGTFVLPYQADPVGGYYVGDGRFYYSNGIISLATGSVYSAAGTTQYFNFDGTPAFILEETENKYTDEDGKRWEVHTFYRGSRMVDGYAVAMQYIHSSYSVTGYGAAFGGGDSEYKTMIVDRNGEITCELPQEFNEDIGFGAGGIDTEMSLEVCGEGLFAFFENSYDENWNYTSEGKGYMDPAGKTVIDLEGRGFRNLGPFTNGLAWVVDNSGKVDFIDKTGALVIPCIYESASSFSSDGLADAQIDGKWGYIDKNGETVIPFEYDGAYGAGDGLASVVKDGKCGLVDYGNNVVVPLEYDDISSFEGGAAYGIKDGLVYIITS